MRAYVYIIYDMLQYFKKFFFAQLMPFRRSGRAHVCAFSCSCENKTHPVNRTNSKMLSKSRTWHVNKLPVTLYVWCVRRNENENGNDTGNDNYNHITDDE